VKGSDGAIIGPTRDGAASKNAELDGEHCTSRDASEKDFV
jgi:hypothetical protein